MTRIVRVAAAQLQPDFMNLPGSVAIAESAIAEAGRNGARLIVFPETWLPGFPLWMFSGTGWRDDRYQQAHVCLLNNSVEVPGPAVSRLCAAARAAGVNVVIGINERDGRFSKKTLYNALLYISDEGVVLGVHRKLKLTHMERIIWGEGDGSGLLAFDTSVGRLGGLVCWEHWMPLNRFAMHALGEEIHAAVYPDIAEHNAIGSRQYAFEGRCFVIAVGAVQRRAAIQVDFGIPFDTMPGPSPAAVEGEVGEFILSGGSGIIGPDGRWVVGPTFNVEEILYADIDLDEVSKGKLSLDVAGHFNRPDIFQLTVDRRPRPQVQWRLDASRSNEGDPAQPDPAYDPPR